jgi:hypothetical protein
MEFLIIGIATALNIIIIKMKLEKKRWEDATLDASLLVLITIVFGGSYAGLVVGTIASMVISFYLYASPPTFTKPLLNKIRMEIVKANELNKSPIDRL